MSQVLGVIGSSLTSVTVLLAKGDTMYWSGISSTAYTNIATFYPLKGTDRELSNA